jgi:hypothetical protein
MLAPGVDADAFLAGLGLGLGVLFAAWVPLASIGLLRRLLGMS